MGLKPCVGYLSADYLSAEAVIQALPVVGAAPHMGYEPAHIVVAVVVVG